VGEMRIENNILAGKSEGKKPFNQIKITDYSERN
jgi:hypothetical protein